MVTAGFHQPTSLIFYFVLHSIIENKAEKQREVWFTKNLYLLHDLNIV